MEIGFGGGTYSGPQEISYLFVDGGYLRKVAEKFGSEFFGVDELPINHAVLGNRFTKCFYYDCLPAQRGNEALQAYEARVSEQRARLSTIRSLRGWHVVEGVMVGTGSRARQKQVDIHIAVDLLTHSYGKNMHKAAFIAGDQDFKPVVEAVVRDGMFIEIWYERSSASADLLDAADDRRELNVYSFYGFVDPRFKNTHPLPTRSHSLLPVPATAKPERTGECAQGTATLYSNNGGYILVRRPPDGTSQPLHMPHADDELLERVSVSIDGEIVWQEGS